jgi:hypothetical protein
MMEREVIQAGWLSIETTRRRKCELSSVFVKGVEFEKEGTREKADGTPLYRINTVLLMPIVWELLLPGVDGIQAMVNL